MLASIDTVHPSPRTGSSSISWSRAFWTAASQCPVTSPHSTTNSSPPRRATVSQARAPRRSRSAVARSTASPTAWPWVSLTSLKRSRSMNDRVASVGAAGHPADDRLEAVEKQVAVGQTGQVVVGGHVGQLALALALLAGIGDQRVGPHVAGGDHRLDPELDREQRAVGPGDHGLEVLGDRSAGLQPLGDQRAEPLLLGGLEEAEQGPLLQQLLHRSAEDVGGGVLIRARVAPSPITTP